MRGRVQGEGEGTDMNDEVHYSGLTPRRAVTATYKTHQFGVYRPLA